MQLSEQVHQMLGTAGRNTDIRLIALGWYRLRREPGAFYVRQGTARAKMLCTTDDFLAFSNSTSLLTMLRRQLQREGEVIV